MATIRSALWCQRGPPDFQAMQRLSSNDGSSALEGHGQVYFMLCQVAQQPDGVTPPASLAEQVRLQRGVADAPARCQQSEHGMVAALIHKQRRTSQRLPTRCEGP